MKGIILCLALLVVGCSTSKGLHLRSDFLTPNYLASERINTPDPERPCFYGQQIVVHWRLPRRCLSLNPTLLLSIRFGDHSLEVISFPLTTARGYWTYQLVDCHYFDKEGILSYKAQIVTSTGEEIAEWRHHIWADIIDISEDNEPNCP